ncbi:M6 family metalloprotease domain-containing protein [Streptomyces sp. SL13]|uniref:M6 family metalloprotease domain-containing protein n=1 Tax=Streptantibioticus silvisoli TaxID=2705255 RepID=A0AA90K9I7_9ACTN|nr:M6 family metalloprotease domain-containing protein [Streptantibioticus silvisoli]MDI5967208.1 M6 family metalloprotease domain-containing protein [Streptantibioticus silvisoli]MDI5971188.1 M6 family metalloprotease domain-containing protein [Streptantibioticus silvisoli]
MRTPAGRWKAAAISAVLLLAGGSATVAGLLSGAPATAPPGRPCALPAARGTEMSEGFPAGPDHEYAHSTGELRALTLFIDFPDAPAHESVQQRYREFFPAVPRWYARASFGRLRYHPVPVLRWFRMPRRFATYRITRGYGWDVHREMMRDLVAVAGRSVDFRGYDLVNVIATPNAGPPADQTVLSVTWTGGSAATAGGGARLDRVSVIYGHDQSGPRVLAHENGHILGLPDLYAVRDFGRTDTLAGQWDTMSLDWGLQGDPLAWHKWRLGWLTDRQVVCVATPRTTTVALTPDEIPGGRKAVVVPYGPHTAYVLEARRALGNDSAACSEGVLAYRVRTDVSSGDGPVKVVDANPATSACDFSSGSFNSLNDAPFRPGQRWTDPATGLAFAVLGADRSGGWTVRVTRPR